MFIILEAPEDEQTIATFWINLDESPASYKRRVKGASSTESCTVPTCSLRAGARSYFTASSINPSPMDYCMYLFVD